MIGIKLAKPIHTTNFSSLGFCVFLLCLFSQFRTEGLHKGRDAFGSGPTCSAYHQIVRKLAAQDPANTQAQTDLVIALFNISRVTDPAQARATLTEALSILERLENEGRLTTAQKKWPDMIRTALGKLP
jgi:hypothetical protein